MSAVISHIRGVQRAPYFDAAAYCAAVGKRWSDFCTNPWNISTFESVAGQLGCSVDDLVQCDGPRVWVHPLLVPHLDAWLRQNIHTQEKVTMNAIVSFSFEGMEVRTVPIDGEPWFVGKDVAERLGYADPTNAMKQHCKGVVKRHPLSTAGGVQEVRILSEPDVLRLIIGSKLPAAERFERWVFEEVLPTIRKTGSYGSGAGLSDKDVSAILRLADAVGTLSAQVGALIGRSAPVSTAATRIDAVPLSRRSPRDIVYQAVCDAGKAGIVMGDLTRKTQMLRPNERRQIVSDLSADGLVKINYVRTKGRTALWVGAATLRDEQSGGRSASSGFTLAG